VNSILAKSKARIIAACESKFLWESAVRRWGVDYGMATHPRPQTLAIIGFGNFGQFLAKTFVRQGHRVLGQSRSDYSTAAKELGAEYFKTADEVLDQNPDVVILCTSIMSLKTVMKKFPLQRYANDPLNCGDQF